ncbi:hypothetical protein [Wenyingzhuangia sp. IMCC45574]
MKTEIKKIESFLIEKNFLKNSSGKSYYDLFKKVALLEKDISYRYDFIDSIQGMEIQPIEECEKINLQLLKDESSKTSLLKKELSSLNNENNISPKLVAEKLLTLLDEKDFENYLQKMKVLLLIENFKSIDISSVFPTEKLSSNENNNSIKIEIDGENKIWLNGESVELNEMFDKRITSYVKNQIKSFKITTSSKSKFSIFSQLTERLKKINSEIKFSLEISE